jgi:hypothetical protein
MRMRTVLLVFGFLALTASRTAGPKASGEIDTFNRKFVDLILKTDHAGMIATWAEDGVDLMPGEAPLVGKSRMDKKLVLL